MSRSRSSTFALAIGLAGAVLLARPAGAEEVSFNASSTIAVTPNATRLRAADFDRDGDLDLAGHMNYTVRWYERDPDAALGFVEHEAHTYPDSTTIGAFEIGDVDGDGWVDILVYRDVEGFGGGTVILDWLENDGLPTDGLWTSRNIKTWEDQLFIDSQDAFSLAVGDLNGDGNLDVAISRDILTGPDREGQIEWIGNDGTPLNGGWDGHVLRDWVVGVRPYSLRTGDLDGDGDLDLIGTPEDYPATRPLVWWENDGTPANAPWAEHTIEDDLAHSFACLDDIDLGDIDRDGDLDVVQALGLNVFWWQNDGTPDAGEWTRRQIPADAAGACSVRLADVDRDGDLDAVTDEPGVGWYENDGTPAAGSWTFHSIENVPCDGILVADLDGDGDPDVAGSDYTEFFWFENREVHRSPLLRDEEIVDELVDGAFDLLAVDLDRDGDVDLLSAAEANDHLYWHRNDGSPGPGTWPLSTISSLPDGPRAVAAGDLDGDGDVDLAAGSYNDDSVAWYENDGSLANWTQRSISGGADGAQDVVVADLDGDGDLDVGAAQYLDNEVSWYRNDGGSPPAFTPLFVDDSAYSGPFAMAAGDIDGDGDLDLAVVFETADAVVWYANDGTPADGEWPRHRNDDGADGPKDVALVDLDRDGDLDTVVAADAGNAIWWFENDGSLEGWTGREIHFQCTRGRSVAPGDFDGDGDPDVLFSCFDDDAIWLARNNGASTPSFFSDLLSVDADGARTVVAADLDRDGDLDGAAAQGSDDEIAWYRNVGGQFRVTGTAMAVDPLDNARVQPIFRAVVEHRGRSGDHTIELSRVAMRLEETAGDPLGAFEAASLIDGVQVYADDGDNLFEPTNDLLVADGSAAGIGVDGVVRVDVLDGFAPIPAVTQRRFFVALDFTNPFFGFAPSSLRVTLLTDGPQQCEGEDRSNDLPLDIDPTTSAATATLDLADTCSATEILFIEDETIAGAAEYEACSTIVVGPTVIVENTAEVGLRARDAIAFRDGFAVEAEAELVATIDPDAGSP